MGMPNVGKSAIINELRLASPNKQDLKGRPGKRSKEGVLPGVTRQQQLIEVSTDPHCSLIDTPGVMVKRITNKEVVGQPPPSPSPLPMPPLAYARVTATGTLERWQKGFGAEGGQGCIGSGGNSPPPPPPPSRAPSLRSATVSLTATASFHGICRRQ